MLITLAHLKCFLRILHTIYLKYVQHKIFVIGFVNLKEQIMQCLGRNNDESITHISCAKNTEHQTTTKVRKC